jgi:hypothetical protein
MGRQELGFSARPCGTSERAESDLHVDRGRGHARRSHGGTNVRVEWGEPRRTLSAMAGVGTEAGGYGAARCSAGKSSWRNASTAIGGCSGSCANVDVG